MEIEQVVEIEPTVLKEFTPLFYQLPLNKGARNKDGRIRRGRAGQITILPLPRKMKKLRNNKNKDDFILT